MITSIRKNRGGVEGEACKGDSGKKGGVVVKGEVLIKFDLAVPVILISLSLKVREYHHQMLISQEIVS